MGTNKISAGGLQQNTYGGGKGLFYVGGIDLEFFDQISLRGEICDSILRFLFGVGSTVWIAAHVYFLHIISLILFYRICQYRRSLNKV